MKSIMLYNHGGCGNRGCEAIVRSTSSLFAPHARITLASLTPQEDRLLTLPNISKIVPAKISPYSLARIINSVGYRLGMKREDEVARAHSPVIALGKKSNVCLSIGGDTYCYGHQEHLQVINGRLKRRNIPMVLWGCSVDPELLEGQTLEDLRAYDLIVARESITASCMREAGLPVMRWCDPAFFLESEPLGLPEGWREGDTVGLNVSPLILQHARSECGALDAFVALVQHILRTSDSAVALIPHVTWRHDNDLDALGAIKARFAQESRVFMLPGTLNAMQLKGYIARLKALVTARTHASIAGYSSAVPTLVIGYSVKARGIARDLFGSESSHLIPVQELSGKEELIDAYKQLISRAQAERSFLQQQLPHYTSGSGKAMDAVMALAK